MPGPGGGTLPTGASAGPPSKLSPTTAVMIRTTSADAEPRPRRSGTRLGPTLEIDHVAGDALDGLLDRLGQRRVREHVASDLVGGEVPLLREGQRGQQLGDVGPDEVGADDLVVRRVGDDLDETDGVAEAHGLAVGGEREL